MEEERTGVTQPSAVSSDWSLMEVCPATVTDMHDRIMSSLEKVVRAGGFDSMDPRIATILNVSGKAVDALFGDVLLQDGGLLVIVELRALTCEPGESSEKPGPYENTRVILVTCPSDAESDPTIWIT